MEIPVLNITGQIGSQLELTFVREDGFMVSQQRINGRRAYLCVGSRGVVTGTRCRATIVDENAKRNVFFVRVDEILEHGDGVSSHSQTAILEAEIGCRRSEQNFEQKLIARLRARCAGGAGDTMMLEVLLDVLESYAGDVPHPRADLNYGHYCIAISRLINSLYADDAAKRVELYLRAARYCDANPGGREWATSFRAVADTLKVD